MMAKRGRGGYVRVISNKLPELKRKASGKADQALRALSEEGVSIVVESMRESPATGQTYTRNGVTHTASSPDNPPRPDTSTLLNSIYPQRVKHLLHRIAVGAEHGEYQEFGVEENNLLPRPFMGPMARELERLIPGFFDKFLEDEV